MISFCFSLRIVRWPEAKHRSSFGFSDDPCCLAPEALRMTSSLVKFVGISIQLLIFREELAYLLHELFGHLALFDKAIGAASQALVPK